MQHHLLPTRLWLSYVTALALWVAPWTPPLWAEAATEKKSGSSAPSRTGKKSAAPGEKAAGSTVKKGKSKTAEVTEEASETSSEKSSAKKVPPKDVGPEKVERKTEPETKAISEPKPADPAAAVVKERAPSATIATSDLADFDAQPPAVQRLITNALELTKRNLTYTYGSADPARGGMDCSGTIYYTLRAEGLLDVPRDSPGQYVWVRKAGGFQAVVSTSAETFELDAMRPGDLLFWSGTYAVVREIPITHVMLYLGREKKTGQRVMFGASDGRSYRGVQRWGVSVFDFKMPKADPARGTTPDFIGYGPIPGLKTSSPVALVETPAPAPIAAALKEAEVKTAVAEKAPSSPAAKKKRPSAIKPAASKDSSSRKKPKSN